MTGVRAICRDTRLSKPTRHSRLHVGDEEQPPIGKKKIKKGTDAVVRASPESKANNVLADSSQNFRTPLSWDTQRRKVVFFVSCGVERRKSIYKSMKIFYH